jgi:hypothetical protein
MAGDWIKWTVGLTRKREVVAIASALGLSRREVAAMLMEVWEWADANTTNGHVPSVTNVTLDEFLNCDGFAQAMQKEGWLVFDGTSITFPNFDRHNGKSAKSRALAANRKRAERVAVTKVSRSKRDTSTLLFSSLLSTNKEGESEGGTELGALAVLGQVIQLSMSDYQSLLVNNFHGNAVVLHEVLKQADDWLCYKGQPAIASDRSAAYVRNWKKKSAEFRKGSPDAALMAQVVEQDRDRKFFNAFGKDMEEYVNEPAKVR